MGNVEISIYTEINKNDNGINVEKNELDDQNKLKNTGRISDLGNAEISVYTELRPILTLKE